MHKFELGQQAKDRITGISGTITGYCHYITGCDQACIQPKATKDSSYIEGRWFDVNRVDKIKGQKIEIDVEEDNGPCECMPPIR